MIPVVALVGRPNVGKSTLFNRLTRSRDAIVIDVPGVTRDRNYGEGRAGLHRFIVVDTGGFEPGADTGLEGEVARQTEQAIAEADVVLFVVDTRAGLTAADEAIGARLRRAPARVQVVVNKAEGFAPDLAIAEFHALGLGQPAAISAAHGEGVGALIEELLSGFPAPEAATPAPDAPRRPKVAIVGRPNVGKSTLVNALVGEARVIALDRPGTTRDAIEVPFERNGREYTLIDTAGLRRRGRQGEMVERTSIVKTLQAIDACNVVVLLLDAVDGISEQDAHVAGYLVERGRAVVVAINKWDAVDERGRKAVKDACGWKLGFLAFADLLTLSARAGHGLGRLMAAVDAAYDAAMAKLPTPRLTRTLIAAVARQAPPRVGVIRPKPRFAHQGGSNPPRVIVHGNALDRVPESYRRYLEGVFRTAFNLRGTPLVVEFRSGRNPYARSRAAGR